MKKIVDNVRNENGSITLYVLIAVLFLVIIISINYSMTANKKIAQDKEFNKIKEEYEKEYSAENGQLFINTDISRTNPEAAIPSDVTLLERDADKGIVIQDGNKNEWVWIEVPKNEVFTSATSKTDYINIENDLIAYAENYRNGSSVQSCDWKDEWYAIYEGNLVTASSTDLTDTQKALNNGCGLTYDEYEAKYKKMLSSVYSYGGFWISRYEMGDSTATIQNEVRTGDSGITGKPVSRVDQIPYNYVTCSQAQALSNNISTDTTKTSSLLFGIQWDLVCKFLEVKSNLEETDINTDSLSWGNYKNSSLRLNSGKYNTAPETLDSVWTKYTIDTENYVSSLQTSDDENYYQLLTTGASEQASKMNIYDWSGNEWEWTLERASNTDKPCAYRGRRSRRNIFKYSFI